MPEPRCRTKTLCTAEIAEHAEKRAEGTSYNNHGFQEDGLHENMILSALSAYSAVNAAATCKIWAEETTIGVGLGHDIRSGSATDHAAAALGRMTGAVRATVASGRQGG